jgi:altronate hydrolase
MTASGIIINPRDNVAIALRDIKKGELLSCPEGRVLTVLSEIAYSHKVSMEDIPVGAEVFKYGEIIGEAKEPIRKGDWVHTHNLDIEDKKR